MTVAEAAPARPANSNKAFEPPPGWTPPATAAVPQPVPPPVQTAAVAPPPLPMPVANAASARPADPNKAFEPPPAWTPPAATVALQPVLAPIQTPAAPPPPPSPPAALPVAEAPPARPADPNKAFEPPSGWTPPSRPQTANPASSTPAAARTPPPTANVATAAVAPPAGASAAPTQAPIATVPFASQSAEIPEHSKAELGRLAKTLKGARQIELHAYAGGGDPIDDSKVALARALAVRAYLVDLGVANSRIDVASNDAVPRGDGITEYVDIVVPR